MVDEKTVSLVIGEASPAQVQKMIRKALFGDFMEARKKMYEIMGSYGFSGSRNNKAGAKGNIQNVGS